MTPLTTRSSSNTHGGATYADLKAATQLQPGPLYHHINGLRLAGLIGPKTRGRYVLTEMGVQAALAARVLHQAWA